MEIMPLVIGFGLAYAAFVGIGYLLARLIFPSMESEEEERQGKLRNKALK